MCKIRIRREEVTAAAKYVEYPTLLISKKVDERSCKMGSSCNRRRRGMRGLTLFIRISSCAGGLSPLRPRRTRGGELVGATRSKRCGAVSAAPSQDSSSTDTFVESTRMADWLVMREASWRPGLLLVTWHLPIEHVEHSVENDPARRKTRGQN